MGQSDSHLADFSDCITLLAVRSTIAVSFI